MRKHIAALSMLLFSLLVVNVASAYGYGTSSISLASGSARLTSGNGTSVSYTVNLASGSTWGTTLNVVNAQQLDSQGIAVTLSPSSGDPTFSGTMSIKVGAAAQAGTYTIVLQATGDDPSTSNATFALTVLAPATTSAQTTTTNATQNKTSSAQQTTSLQQTTTIRQPTTTASQPTTSANYYNSPGAYYGSGNATAQLASSALIILIILGALYGLFMWKSMLTRLVVIGTALILIGTVAWLYGDYLGGIQSYIWGGFAGILVGTAAWIYGDIGGGTFKQALAGRLSLLGIILILIGAFGWAYGELYSPGMSAYWWGGTALLVIGTLAWLYGDVKAGAFLKKIK
ncbi:MAG: hypothetical protein KGH57_02835 [Candidatus Micrarchaeota archaeon]|nr:hypothetical protein [Candidatus Micrarchaeota archaeon]